MRILITENQLRLLIESQIDWSSKRVRKRAGHSDILFLSPAKILERVGKDMPEFDIRKQGVKIGDRLEKAKEYLRNVMDNPEFDTVEGTNVYLEWWKYDNNGERVEFDEPKVGIADGRHRLMAAYELGLGSFPIEIYSNDEEEQERSKQYLLKNFAPTSDSNVSLQTTNSSKQEEIPNQPIVQNNDQELLNSINNELKYLKGNFDRFMKPNFEKFYKGDVGSKKELLSSIVSTFMYVNKLNDLLVKSGKSKNVPYESTDSSLNVSMEKLLNRFLFIEKNFELFFGNELTINNLNNFLPRIAVLLKIFYHSVNNFV
jgi:uncharacterized protein (DUF736 family)